MSKPLLSVCLITYNHAHYIKESIDTILSQEVDFDWQLIIADDFSTDGTRQIIQEYQKKHPEIIKLVLQKKNVGPESNWLDLLSEAKTKYVLYAEGDDYFCDTSKLQRQVDFLETHKDFSICFHPVKVIYDDGSRRGEIFPNPEQRWHKDVLGLNDLLTSNFMQTNSTMYRWRFANSDVRKVFPSGIAPGDWFLHILHAELGKIGFIDRAMAVYRKHPGGLWWGSGDVKPEFWLKNGPSWLKIYTELLNRYGSDHDSRQAIEGSLINFINYLPNSAVVLQTVIASSPVALGVYIDNLKQQIIGLKHHSDEQAKIIEHYLRLNKDLDKENKLLSSKPLVRLQKVVGRNIRRNK